ncbi:hypothetical protein [Natrinema hispanicum]|nr:hypothetical protein [Natrinema hispanicum]
MPFQPPVECPICRETLALDRTLEEHLVGSHTPTRSRPPARSPP